jgi:beta-glucanase (GH16 family)
VLRHRLVRFAIPGALGFLAASCASFAIGACGPSTDPWSVWLDSGSAAAPPGSPESSTVADDAFSPAGDDGGTPPSPDDAASSGSPAPSGGGASSDGASASLPGWTLTWSDEFEGPDGTAVDPTKWNQETGNGGWNANRELEYYTPGTANAVVSGGSLVITATDSGASAYTCGYGTCQYTSARFNTKGKFSQAYGLFEARIQIPRGQGLWPAFWTLGDDIGTAGWPTCGEIDIMENIGSQPPTNHGSLHGPGYSGGHPLTGSISIDAGALADDFHVYDIEWAPNVVRFYLDGVLYETHTSADVPAGDKWVYDHPFFVILNVAVGGTFPGSPNASTTFPQTMKVDYVRVYANSAPTAGDP